MMLVGFGMLVRDSAGSVYGGWGRGRIYADAAEGLGLAEVLRRLGIAASISGHPRAWNEQFCRRIGILDIIKRNRYD